MSAPPIRSMCSSIPAGTHYLIWACNIHRFLGSQLRLVQRSGSFYEVSYTIRSARGFDLFAVDHTFAPLLYPIVVRTQSQPRAGVYSFAADRRRLSGSCMDHRPLRHNIVEELPTTRESAVPLGPDGT